MRLAFLGNFQVSYSSETHHARSLEKLGHSVVRLQEGRVPPERMRQVVSSCNALIWVHTHGWHNHGIEWVLDAVKKQGKPVIGYHLDLYYGIPQRLADYQNDPYFRYVDHFFTVDGPLADWFNANTDVKGYYLPPGVVHDECELAQPDPRIEPLDVIFVGSLRYHQDWPYRGQLIGWLHANYPARFKLFGQDAGHVVRGRALNRVYANSKIVIGDSFNPGFNYGPYTSDRLTETLGRGGFLIYPRFPGIDDIVTDGEHYVGYDYNDWADLKEKIEYYLSHDEEREAIRKAGHEHVRDNHTYRHRWDTILKEVLG